MKAKANSKNKDVRLVVMIPVLVLAVSVAVFAVVMATTPIPLKGTFSQTVNRYLFVFVVTGVFLFEMGFLFIIEKACKITFAPALIFACYSLFLTGTYLGNVASMYHMFPLFDNIVHLLLGVSMSMLGVGVYYLGNGNENNADPKLVALFAFFAGTSIGAIWEVAEFLADLFFNMNMQKYILENGEVLVGKKALFNTMIDTIMNISGAMAIAALSYISAKYNKNWHKFCKITKK